MSLSGAAREADACQYSGVKFHRSMCDRSEARTFVGNTLDDAMSNNALTSHSFSCAASEADGVSTQV